MEYLKTFVLNAEMNIPLSLVLMLLEPEYGAAAVTGPLPACGVGSCFTVAQIPFAV